MGDWIRQLMRKAGVWGAILVLGAFVVKFPTQAAYAASGVLKAGVAVVEAGAEGLDWVARHVFPAPSHHAGKAAGAVGRIDATVPILSVPQAGDSPRPTDLGLPAGGHAVTIVEPDNGPGVA